MKVFNLALCAAALLVISSCSKNGTTTPVTPVTSPKMKFSVNNLVDITLKQYRDTTVYVTPSVVFDSGLQEPLTLTLADLPAGVTVTPASLGGTPSFGGIFTFHVDAATSGVFPVKIVATTTSGTVKNYTFNLTTLPNSSCAASIVGSYNSHTVCTPDFSTPVDFQGTVDATNDNLVGIPTFYTYLAAHINCTNGTFTTDPRHTSDFEIGAGTGTFDAHTIIAHYTLTTSDNVVHNVTSTVTR